MNYQISQSELRYQLIKSDYKYKSYTELDFERWTKEINMGMFDFSKLVFYTYEGRRLASYKDNPKELALVNTISSKVNRHFNIKYNNRNALIREMVNNLLALKRMNDFSIIKFDFKKYFPSISTSYVYEHYIKHSSMPRDFKAVTKNYCEKVIYSIPGISLSNSFAELIAKDFDESLTKSLSEYGILFYKRYVDDVIILLNSHIDKSKIHILIENSIKEIYYKPSIGNKNRTKINQSKFQVINKRFLTVNNNFNFLGYDFTFVSDDDFTIGITDSKKMKYKKKIKKLVKNTHTNPLLLRHVIKANSSRIVYCTSKDEKKALWKVKGIVSNYTELRRFPSKIDIATEKFLKNVYYDVFKDLGIKIPHYLHTKRYQLFNNIMKNTTLIFDEKIGVDIDTVRLNMIAIGGSYKSRHTYNQLIRNYLISVKVGH